MVRVNCHQKIRKSLYIIGIARSGTTILGTAISVLPEYADYLKLYDSIVAYAYVVSGNWSSEQSCRYYVLLYRLLLLAAGACDLHNAEKNTNHSYICDFLSLCFPDSRFIHIIRDGRDVTASILERLQGRPTYTPPWAEAMGYHDFSNMPMLERSMLAWSSAVMSVSKVGLALPAECYHEVRYEDVVSDPGREAQQLSHFLEIQLPESSRSIEQALLQVRGESVGRWRRDFRLQ